MELCQAFPIAIIDEDYEGKNAAGRGMRQLADAIEKQGFRVISGLSYKDARRLVNVANNESCSLQSGAGTIDCPSSFSETSLPPRWCRQVFSSTPTPSCVSLRTRPSFW